MTGIIVIADCARGQYQGQAIGEMIQAEPDAWHYVTDDDARALLAGPDHENYDEALCAVLDNAEYTVGGRTYLLATGPCGDILGGCEAAMTAAELAEWLEGGDDDRANRVALRLAVEMSAHFETATRPNGDAFDRLKEGAPDWMHDAVRDGAHDGGTFLPNDHSYAAARGAADALAELSADDDADDAVHEWADRYAEAPRWELLRWLQEAPGAFESCNEACADFGPADDLDADLQRGRYAWARDVAAGMLEALRDRAREMLEGDA